MADSQNTTGRPDPQAQWWGHNVARGWVLLDREWTANLLEPRGMLLFVQCKDWTLFTDSFQNWKPGSVTYAFVDRHLETLGSETRRDAQFQFLHLVHEYADKRLALAGTALDQRLIDFCRRTARDKATLQWADSSKYQRPCWKCERRFNSEIDLQCRSCGWFACWNCGACGCTWPHQR